MGFLLFILFFGSSSHAHGGTEERRDFVRKPLNFYEAQVPSRSGGKKDRFAVTVIETYDDQLFQPGRRTPGVPEEDIRRRDRLQEILLEDVRAWFVWLITEGPGAETLNPAFKVQFLNDQTLFSGRNTFVVLSDVDNFSHILALIRIAKPSLNGELPLTRQFGKRLKPFDFIPLTAVPGNIIPVHSFRLAVPYNVVIENAKVYTGDTNELKHYGAVRYRGHDLTGILFHFAEEHAALSVSRYEHEGKNIGLDPGPALIKPARMVASTDNVALMTQLEAAGFTIHQEFPGEFHSDLVTKIVKGGTDKFIESFYGLHHGRKNSWQLNEIEPIARDQDTEFVQRLVGNQCTIRIADSIRYLDQAMQTYRRALISEIQSLSQLQ